MSRVKTYRTSLDELSAAGYELSEEHLRLALGGVKITPTQCRKTYKDPPGVCQCDQGLDAPGTVQ